MPRNWPCLDLNFYLNLIPSKYLWSGMIIIGLLWSMLDILRSNDISFSSTVNIQITEEPQSAAKIDPSQSSFAHWTLSECKAVSIFSAFRAIKCHVFNRAERRESLQTSFNEKTSRKLILFLPLTSPFPSDNIQIPCKSSLSFKNKPSTPYFFPFLQLFNCLSNVFLINSTLWNKLLT